MSWTNEDVKISVSRKTTLDLLDFEMFFYKGNYGKILASETEATKTVDYWATQNRDLPSQTNVTPTQDPDKSLVLIFNLGYKSKQQHKKTTCPINKSNSGREWNWNILLLVATQPAVSRCGVKP